MFKLNRLTDYAVVIMSQMALTPGVVRNASELARETAVPQPTVAKILGILAKSGLVTAHRGAAGGYSLASAPKDIAVSAIIEALEGPIALTACVEGTPDICGTQALCPLRGHWNRVNLAIKDALEKVNLAELAITHGPPGQVVGGFDANARQPL
jgi:FeS assembly SUF system regulator